MSEPLDELIESTPHDRDYGAQFQIDRDKCRISCWRCKLEGVRAQHDALVSRRARDEAIYRVLQVIRDYDWELVNDFEGLKDRPDLPDRIAALSESGTGLKEGK